MCECSRENEREREIDREGVCVCVFVCMCMESDVCTYVRSARISSVCKNGFNQFHLNTSTNCDADRCKLTPTDPLPCPRSHTEAPQCGFSRTVCVVLEMHGVNREKMVSSEFEYPWTELFAS